LRRESLKLGRGNIAQGNTGQLDGQSVRKIGGIRIHLPGLDGVKRRRRAFANGNHADVFTRVDTDALQGGFDHGDFTAARLGDANDFAFQISHRLYRPVFGDFEVEDRAGTVLIEGVELLAFGEGVECGWHRRNAGGSMPGNEELNGGSTTAGALELDFEAFFFPKAEVAGCVKRIEAAGGGIDGKKPGERAGRCVRGCASKINGE
jgi:hypothetical protein